MSNTPKPQLTKRQKELVKLLADKNHILRYICGVYHLMTRGYDTVSIHYRKVVMPLIDQGIIVHDTTNDTYRLPGVLPQKDEVPNDE